jgi:two-component system catabolic regulation response regulator CreB
MLRCLLRQPRRVFSREQLLEAAGVAAGAGYERNVDSHVKGLRAKLRAVSPESDPIRTHRGVGYSYEPEQG